MRLWMGSELTRSEASRRSGIYPYIRIAPDARMRWGRFLSRKAIRLRRVFRVGLTLDFSVGVCYTVNRIQ